MRSTIIEHTGGHVRVLGPPGAGKTRHLVERFRWLEGQGRRVAVITYGSARRERMTGELLERGSARRGHMPVWTFPQLARHVLAAAEPGLRGPLRELQELVLLDRVLGDLDGGLSSDYRSISESPAFRRELLGVIHTLLQNGIGAPEAVTGRDATGDGRARDILRVFVDFRQLLDERRMTTFYDAPWHAARVIGELANPFAGFDTLLVDDFGDIDPGQFKLLLAAIPPGGTIEVNVFGDPSGARFGYRGTSGRFLTEEFAQHYAPTDYELSPVVSKAPERGESQMGLFDTRPVAPSDGRVSTVATYAEDDVAEAQMTADRAAEIVSSGSHALGDIAVIAREPHRYERVLSAAFFDRGVPLDTGRRGHYAIDDYVSAWFVLLTTDVNERNAERLAASPLYDALRARVADELRLHERKVGGDLYDVRDIVRWARKQLPRATFSMERFVDVVVRPVVPDAVNDVRSMAALSHLVDEWGSYVEALSHLGGKADLAGFRRFVAPSPPGRSSEPNQDAVRLLSPLEATGQSFAVVFVVGCSEGIFPVVESGVGYIPFSELERCVPSSPPIHFHQARTREERINDERLLLDSALSRARETLYLSAPKEFDATEIAAPSHLFGDRFEGAPTVERAESVVVHAARAVAAAGAGTFESTRDAPVTATQVEAIWLANPAKAAPFQIDSFAMSPSRLSTYDDCPRKLFYDRVLGLKDEGKIYMTI
ncbi:MAG: ATP-dependent helicase, partial [Candidatus Krumholzibacteriota bacterium]|nr:ATP-dependent helicase [Candidatus Krumholzibacteriota bacterium]